MPYVCVSPIGLGIGAIPPLSSLQSMQLTSPVPVISGHSAFASNLVHWSHSGLISPVNAPAHVVVAQAWPTPTISQSLGLVLSPVLDPAPHKLVQRIISGQFVGLKELLPDNGIAAADLWHPGPGTKSLNGPSTTSTSL